MSEAQPIRISIWALLGWVLAVALVVGGLGWYPTVYWSQIDGLHAMAWAMAVVMTAMLVSGLLIARSAKDGAAAAAMMFVMVSMIRIGVCMALTVVGWWLLALPLSPLLIWMFVLYIAMLFTEPFKCKRYLVSVLIIFLWNFFATTTGSYYTVYMLETLKVNYSFLSVCSAMYVPITMFLAPVWARYINRTSWLAVFWKVLIMYGLFFCGHSFVNVSCIWLYPVVVFLCFLFSPAVNLVMSNMAFYNIPRENQTIYLSFCSTLSMVGAILGNLFATQFMLRTADVDFRVFGMHMLNNQFMPTITGLLIMLLGGIVYFIHRREVAMEKKAPPVPEPF